MLVLLFCLFSLSLAQNLYGPSQLDQYARLLNSGNLGGFGWLNTALQQGTVRGFADLEGTPRLQGLPPLPLTHEEVMYQLTSTSAPPITAATARPTPAPPAPLPMQGIYAINPIPEMPPMPEERIRGKFDDDGVFHPDKASSEEEHVIRRNQIQGTKIRDFSEPEGKKIASKRKELDDVTEYEVEEFYDDPSLRVASDDHRLARRQPQKNGGIPRVTNVDQLARSRPAQPQQVQRPQQRAPQQRLPQQRPQFDAPRQVQVQPTRFVPKQRPRPHPPIQHPRFQQQTQQIQQPINNFPQFVFQPKPAPANRDPVLGNLLSEVEEYDDFLDQQTSYHEQFPAARLQNPYRSLPEGQLPQVPQHRQVREQQLPGPGQSPQFDAPRPREFQQRPAPAQPAPVWIPQQNTGPVQQVAPSPVAPQQYPAAATEHPLLGIFNLFSIPHHPHALGAPNLRVDKDTPEAQTTQEGAAFRQGNLLPANGLVDIQQRPLNLAALQNPLNLTPLFGPGK